MKANSDLMEYRKQLGKRLKTIRLEKELKQEDISKLFGISKGSVSEYENGKNEPSPRFLLNFAKEFGVNVAWLLEGSAKPKYYEETQSSELKIRDEVLEYQKTEDKMLLEVINHLKADKELLETVWHLVKARQGIRKVSKGE